MTDEQHEVSREIMSLVDEQPREVRKLIHEYGLNIVIAMLDDGVLDADELEFALDQWRERRQREWLATNYVQSRRNKVAAAFERALLRNAMS